MTGAVLGGGFHNFLDLALYLGLGDGLKAVFDTGDPRSWPGSGQTLFDLNGDDDMWLGADGDPGSDDPPLEGAVGALSRDNAVAFGSSQRLRFKATPSWVQTFHKNNAVFAIAGIATFAASGDGQSFITNQGSFTHYGVGFGREGTTGKLSFFARHNIPDSNALSITSTTAIPSAEAVFSGLIVDEAAGAGGAHLNQNGALEDFNATYSSPGGSDASLPSDTVFTVGSRLHGLLFWQGDVPTPAKLDTFRQLAMERFNR